MDKEFKPQQLSVNYTAFNKASIDAKDKLITFNSIIDWIAKEIDISKINLDDLYKDVTTVFQQAYIKENDKLANVPLSYEKTKFLLELDDTQLNEMVFVLYENASDLEFKNNKAIASKIDINKYTRFTRSQNENDKLEAVSKLVEALDDISKHTKVYKGTIQSALGNFVIHNRGSDSLNLNLALLPRVTKQ